LQYVAGHDSIKTTMRNVHPQEDTVETLFIRLASSRRGREVAAKTNWNPRVQKVGAEKGGCRIGCSRSFSFGRVL
jgi:hypothetical protein